MGIRGMATTVKGKLRIIGSHCEREVRLAFEIMEEPDQWTAEQQETQLPGHYREMWPGAAAWRKMWNGSLIFRSLFLVSMFSYVNNSLQKRHKVMLGADSAHHLAQTAGEVIAGGSGS